MFFAFVFLFLLKPRIRKRSNKKGFESPTGYQKPLTISEWFFASLISFFAEATKTEAQTVAFRIVVVNYAAIVFILGSFRPLSVTELMCIHFRSSPDQRLGFAFLAAA